MTAHAHKLASRIQALMFAQPCVIALGRIALLTSALVMPRAAAAQSAPDTTTIASRWHQPLTAWGSVGLGAGALVQGRGGDVAGVVRGNVSIGPWLMTYRGSDVGPFSGGDRGVRDAGILAGMRTGGHRLFGSAALGYARANSYFHQYGGSPDVAPSVGALAYDVTVHANARVPGIALSMSGDIGPLNITYTAFTVSVELGWFGR